ncbi:MAG: DNA recombinase [Gammaproteobacteria bacterium]|nr:DNA recombinase [Gammaproteobacteria bacterium]
MSNQLTIPQCLDQAQSKFNTIAVKNNDLVKWEEEKQFAMQTLQGNSYIAKCVPHTIINAVVNVASIGLTLNPARGYAYLVPEYSKANGGQECQLRISFKGLMKIATDSGQIDWVKADVVKANDKFSFNGAWELPTHQMDAFGDRGNPIGVYCVAKLSNGGQITDVMKWDEVMKIKSCAKTQNVWEKWPEEMAKKAIIKRASKQWPNTELRLDTAIDMLNENEGSESLQKQEKTIKQKPIATVSDVIHAINDAGFNQADIAQRAMKKLDFVFNDWEELSGEHCAEVVELVSILKEMS